MRLDSFARFLLFSYSFSFTLALSATTRGQAQQAGPVERPFLGLQTELKNPQDLKSGVIVAYIWPLSAAKEMGFQIGDEIRTLNDVLITDPESFSKEVQKENVNAKLRFQIRRSGEHRKIEGRIGSREKTMKAYQESVRKELAGKPLPPLPGAVWWNPETKNWDEKLDPTAGLKGKLSVVMSFDDCEVCKEKRYQRLTQMKTLLSKTTGALPLEYLGIFYDERPGKAGKEANLKTAAALFTSSPPAVPIAVAFYPGDKPTPADREKQVLIHNHGVAILNTSGNVEFIQTLGVPDQDFGVAFQKAIQSLVEKAPETTKPDEKKKAAGGDS